MSTLMIIASGSSIEEVLIEQILKRTQLKLILYLGNKKMVEKYQDNGRITAIDGNVLKTQALTKAMKSADIIFADIHGIDMGAETKSIIVAMDQSRNNRLILLNTSKKTDSLNESIHLLNRFGIDHTEIQPQLTSNQAEGLKATSSDVVADQVIQLISE